MGKNWTTKQMKKTFTLLLMLLLSSITFAQVSTWDGTWEPWTHGTGTEADPFLIENAQQLAYLAYRVNNGLDAGGGHVSNHDYHYKLMVDVNLNGSESFQWMPIGYWNSDTDYQCFGGHFDGNNHTISGLYVNSNANRVGFFGYTNTSKIINLVIKDSSINTSGGWNNSYAGGIVGFAYSTIVTNCNNTASICASSDYYYHKYCGGIVGSVSGGTTRISNCYNTGSIGTNDFDDRKYCGGIVGNIGNGTIIIINCYNVGNIGGIIDDEYKFNGGIVGNAESGTISINNCYNIGNICSANTGCSGGIVGNSENASVIVTNSYYLIDCGGNNNYGGQPVSADVMKSQQFVETLNNGFCAWEYDYNNTNSGYPILTGLSFSAVTKPATNVSTTSALLNGSIIVENTNVITKGFEYRAIGTPNYITINISGNESNFSYNVNGLPSNTTYEYRVFVRVSDCESIAYGSTATFELSLLNGDTIYINDSDMLRWVSEQCNSGTTFQGKYIKLMNDITLPLNVPNNMTSIGIYPNYPFKGTFDGNGKHITNLYIDQPNTPYQGFFGYTLNANLYNVGLVNITASGRNYTGGMVAYAENTYLRDCYVNGGTLFALSYCGGLVGYQEQGTNSIISGCYNTCEVSGNNYVGGLVGFSNYSTVRNSYVAAMVAAQGDAVGSIIGGANEVLMYYTYFNAELTGQTNAIGWNNTGGGKDGGEAMTSAQMRDPQFVATLNQGLTVHVWKQDYTTHINNGFPILQWQVSTGVEENEILSVAVYPNPTNGNITIEVEDLKHITISNMLGQVIYEGKASGNMFEYDFVNHGAGLYFIRIETSDGVALKKVSVVR